MQHCNNVFRTAAIGGGARAKRIKTIELSKNNRNKVFIHPNDDIENFYILNGEQILFYENRLVDIDGEKVPGQLATDVWTDISWTGIAREGDVEFKNGKKPEALIKRVLEMTTNQGDWVLDSFLGSGTTAAVAHKMGRRWIGIELGEHCHTHCLPRLKSVVDGTDQGGISKIIHTPDPSQSGNEPTPNPSQEGNKKIPSSEGIKGWVGGGGFKYYYLAPSLLKKDKHDNWIIDERYNADMLAAAMAKHEGFRYCPDEHIYWKQGRSTEKDYIFITTQFVTVQSLDKIHEEMKPDESLLICCKSFKKLAGRKSGG